MSEDSSRYQAQINLPEINFEGQEKLKNSHIAVVGCGGLGAFVLLSLASMGIGTLSMIDYDKVELQNLPRQSLFGEGDVGKFKADVAAEKLSRRNSTLKLHSHVDRLDKSNATELLKDALIVVDCTDNFASKLCIDAYCSKAKIPMVYGGVKGFEGHVSVFNYKDGLSFQESFDQDDLFSNENCTDSGVMPQVVAIAGNLQVNEVVKILLEHDHILQGSLQTFNLLKNVFRVFKL